MPEKGPRAIPASGLSRTATMRRPGRAGASRLGPRMVRKRLAPTSVQPFGWMSRRRPTGMPPLERRMVAARGRKSAEGQGEAPTGYGSKGGGTEGRDAQQELAPVGQ